MGQSTDNVVSLLATAAEQTPDRPAIILGLRDGRSARIDFATLWERVDCVGCGLSELGIGVGDRVVLMIPMSIDLYVVLLAVLKIGAAAVFVDPWVGRRQIADFTAFAEPKAFIGIPKSHLLRLMDRRLRSIPIAITTGRSTLRLPARHSLRNLLYQVGDASIAAVDQHDAALITFTTGSSGTPKGVNRTHGYLLAQHHALQQEFPYTDNDTDLTMFPVFALNNLAKGITTVVPYIDFKKVAEADGQAILHQIQSEAVTTITASPPLIDRLQEALPGDVASLTLRRILVGGAPVSDQQLRCWQQSLPRTEIVVVYGSTEAEPVAHISGEERLKLKSEVRPATPGFCTGLPTPLLGTKVIRIEEKPIILGQGGWQEWELDPGQIGELVVSGDHVGKDYYRNPEATAANKIFDGDRCWHRMGDTGYFDSKNYFWLTGRVHSTICRDGQLIHPQLVEQAAHGVGVVRVAALGVEDEQLGERVVVVIESAKSEKEFVKQIAERLVERSVSVDEILLTSEPLPVDPRHNSKIDYGKLRALVKQGRQEERYTRWLVDRILSPQGNHEKCVDTRN